MTALHRARPVDHYENFPVASWLCPPRLRPAVAAIYWFARTADDLADEGDASPQNRLDELAAYRADLHAIAAGRPPSDRWPAVFGPLARALAEWQLPVSALLDLLSAFEQDVVKTRDGAGYADRAELLDYCRRSANPVGRLMLHLYGVSDATSLARSDAVCTALQLINFWQDVGQDLARGRRYLPDADCLEHGVDPIAPAASPAAQRAALLEAECAWARGLMLEGAPLVHRVPGRAGWELRAVVQGGLRILDRIEALGFDTFRHRPRLGPLDVLVIGARMVRM
ncbi:squalene synthase HpnC [Ramlibacter henchirensis]|uniref:Squalene synthase HpnC n=1 Tax=Ramlibacter henchirensis TaxID=204072 RepID=A0A4Z0BQW9_9BURK|nr:squalene synthase HpnC [Ramlibacter henchirensis]TFZ00425.1 squalene synthase HpnC [Ramlibacter henchirensis]